MAWKSNKQNTEYVTYDEPQGDVILEITDSKVIVAEESEFNGSDLFGIRQFYQNRDGKWCRGKGLSVASDLKDDLLAAIVEYAENGPKKKKKVVKESSRKRVEKEDEDEDDKPTRKSSSKSNRNTPSQRTSRLTTNKKTTEKTSTKSPRRASRLADF